MTQRNPDETWAEKRGIDYDGGYAEAMDALWRRERAERDIHYDERCDLRDGSCGHRSITDCFESRVQLPTT